MNPLRSLLNLFCRKKQPIVAGDIYEYAHNDAIKWQAVALHVAEGYVFYKFTDCDRILCSDIENFRHLYRKADQ